MAWVDIERASDIAQAQIIKSFLEAHGIKVLIPDEQAATHMHYLTPALGFVRIQVDAADVDQAEKLLSDMRVSAVAPTDGDVTPQLITRANQALRLAIFGLMMIPLLLNAYSVVIMVQVFRAPGTLPSEAKRKLFLASIFNIFAFGLWSAVFYSVGFNPLLGFFGFR